MNPDEHYQEPPINPNIDDTLSPEEQRDLISMVGLVARDVKHVENEMMYEKDFYDAGAQRMRIDPSRILHSTAPKVRRNGNTHPQAPVQNHSHVPQQVQRPQPVVPQQPEVDKSQLTFDFMSEKPVQNGQSQVISDVQVGQILNRIGKMESIVEQKLREIEIAQKNQLELLKKLEGFLSGEIVPEAEVNMNSPFLNEQA